MPNIYREEMTYLKLIKDGDDVDVAVVLNDGTIVGLLGYFSARSGFVPVGGLKAADFTRAGFSPTAYTKTDDDECVVNIEGEDWMLLLKQRVE